MTPSIPTELIHTATKQPVRVLDMQSLAVGGRVIQVALIDNGNGQRVRVPAEHLTPVPVRAGQEN